MRCFSVLDVQEKLILVLALIFSNLNGMLALLGLTGTNACAQAKSWQGTVLTHLGDKAKLRNSVDNLKMAYHRCAQDDDAGSQKILDTLDEYFKALGNARTSEK
jgi:hypothetical protein